MNNTTLTQLPTNFQFLSVCHYITSFGLFFYNQNLIPLDRKNHSSCVLNTFFDYIHKSENESSTKIELLRRVLAGSDLYGGGENETLDMKYVNETYQYIISNALFSHYGNIHGYLAEIISEADNITHLALKETVFQKLSKTYISRDFCSSRYESYELSNLTINKVFHEYVWSMFPEPEQNMEIIDINYMYAMIGLKIARSVKVDSVNLSFDNCILLSRDIELQTFNNETHALALELFATPALFYYAHKNGRSTHYRNWTKLMINDQFWQEAYKDFFYFTNNSLQETVKGEIENTLHYKLERELEQLQSRTLIASKKLQTVCQYSKLEDVPSFFVDVYKTVQWTLMYVLPDRCIFKVLPNLENEYNSQFDLIGPLFSEIEHNSLEKVLADGGMIEKLNSKTTVKLALIENYPMRCNYCSPIPRKKNDDIYLLFAIIKDDREDFYALRQENNSLTLLTCNGNEGDFSRVVSNYSSVKMDIPMFAKVLKHDHEDYKVFIKNVVKMKTDQFVSNLKAHYREPTGGEKVIDFLKSLVPFYTCIQSLKSGNEGGATVSCSLDVFSLLPFGGVAGKYTSILWRNVITQIGKQELSFFSKSLLINGLPFTGIGQIYKIAVRTVAEEILIQEILKDFSIASLRALDPGFELSFQVFGFFNQVLRKLIRNLTFSFRNLGEIKSLLLSVERKKMIKGDMDLSPDHTGLVPKIIDQRNNYKIVRYLYPGGSNYFGPMCVSSFGKTAELRTVEDDPFQIPVVAVKSPTGGSTSYQEFLAKSGKLSENKYELQSGDVLRKIGNYINLLVAEGKDISVLRNYHVYHNTVEWNKPKTSQVSEVNNQRPSSSRQTNYIFRQDPDRTVSLLEKFTKTGLLGLKKDKELLSFRKLINSIDSYQSRQDNRKSLNLWFSETLARPSIVETLKNRKGKNFYFNDLTLLTGTLPGKMVKYPLKTEVRYQLRFECQYGLVDISTIGDSFKSQYILYPEVEFKLTDVEYINGKEILLIKLEQKAIGMEEWLQIRERDGAYLENRLTQSRRSDLIEDAALEISSNIPLHSFRDSEQFLRSFLLRIDDESRVPTYDTLAREISTGATIPNLYNEWRIKNHMFIDDVLFQSSLHQVATFEEAKQTINHVYNGIYNQVIERVFDIYHSLGPVRYSMRFEDFYVMYSYFYNTLRTDVHSQRRVVAAICRLALRQARVAWSNTPITIYYALNIPKSLFSRIIRHKTGGDINFSKIQPFYSDRDVVVRNCRGTRPSEVLVLYELEMTNRAGIADLTYILNNPEIEYYIPHEMTMTIRRRNRETIQGRDVFVLTLQFDKLPIENRLVEIVNKLHELYFTGSTFYHS